MRRVREIVVVEGKYDKNAVSQAVDCTVIETSGFGIFSDGERVGLLRELAEKRGLILLMDSDRAGEFIRGRLRGMLERGQIKNAYIPDVSGRERRKAAPSKEGKLGVEGMPPEVILNALERAGATFEDEGGGVPREGTITKADMYILGLSGGDGSISRRRALMKKLNLPSRMSSNELLHVLNILFSREEFLEYVHNDEIPMK